MGCARCGKQRQNVKKALQNKNFKQAGKEIGKGAGMMAGNIKSAVMPGPSGRRK